MTPAARKRQFRKLELNVAFSPKGKRQGRDEYDPCRKAKRPARGG